MRKIRKFSDFISEKIEWSHYRFSTPGEREVADVAEETLESSQLCVIEKDDRAYVKLEQMRETGDQETVLETDRHTLFLCEEAFAFLCWERLGTDGEPIETCFILRAQDAKGDLNEARREEMTDLTRKDLDMMKKGIDNEEDAIKLIVSAGFEKIDRKMRTADAVFMNPKTRSTYVSHDNGYVRHVQALHKNWLSKDVKYMTPLVDYMVPSRLDRLLIILRNAMKKAGLWSEWKKSRSPLGEWIHSKRGRLLGSRMGI